MASLSLYHSHPPPRSSCGRVLCSPSRNGAVRCSTDRQALFNRIAPVYDNLNDVLSLGQHRTWKKMCASWSGAKRGDRVLDLCCGSGDLAFLLSQKVGDEGQVSALDFSREQLSIASTRQELVWKTCYKNIEWIEGDALNLPFADSYFDAITMGYGLRNLTDKHKALQEIFRVLKPGCCIFRGFNQCPYSCDMDFIDFILNMISGSRVSVLDFNKSTSSLASLFQEWMIDNVVVPVASTYGLSKEYEYLKASIAEFLTGRELEKLAEEVGFSNCKHYEIAGGLMGNLIANRYLN